MIPSHNWKKNYKLVERKILTLSSLESPTAIDESVNEERNAATVAILNTKFFNFQFSQLFCSAHTVQRVQKYVWMGGRFIFMCYLCKRLLQSMKFCSIINGRKAFGHRTLSDWKKGFCPKVNFKITNMQQLYQRRLDKKNNITYIKYKVKRYITPHLVNFGTIIIRGNFVWNIILVSTSTSICTFSGCHFFFL